MSLQNSKNNADCEITAAFDQLAERKNRVCVSFYEFAQCPFEDFCEHAHHYDELTANAQKLLLQSVSAERIPRHFLEPSKPQKERLPPNFTISDLTNDKSELSEHHERSGESHTYTTFCPQNMETTQTYTQEQANSKLYNTSKKLENNLKPNLTNWEQQQHQKKLCLRGSARTNVDNNVPFTFDYLNKGKEAGREIVNSVSYVKSEIDTSHFAEKEIIKQKCNSSSQDSGRRNDWKTSTNIESADMTPFQMYLPIRCRYPHPHLPANVSYYEILQLPRGAAMEQILWSYRCWAKTGYKSLKAVNAEEADKIDCLIVEARNVLGNEQLRCEYDALLLTHQQMELCNTVICATPVNNMQTKTSVANFAGNKALDNAQKNHFLPNSQNVVELKPLNNYREKEQNNSQYGGSKNVCEKLNSVSSDCDRKSKFSKSSYKHAHDIESYTMLNAQSEKWQSKVISEITPESQYRTQGQSLDSSTLPSPSSPNSVVVNNDQNFLTCNESGAEFNTHPFSTRIRLPSELYNKNCPLKVSSSTDINEHIEFASIPDSHSEEVETDRNDDWDRAFTIAEFEMERFSSFSKQIM